MVLFRPRGHATYTPKGLRASGWWVKTKTKCVCVYVRLSFPACQPITRFVLGEISFIEASSSCNGLYIASEVCDLYGGRARAACGTTCVSRVLSQPSSNPTQVPVEQYITHRIDGCATRPPSRPSITTTHRTSIYRVFFSRRQKLLHNGTTLTLKEGPDDNEPQLLQLL